MGYEYNIIFDEINVSDLSDILQKTSDETTTIKYQRRAANDHVFSIYFEGDIERADNYDEDALLYLNENKGMITFHAGNKQQRDKVIGKIISVFVILGLKVVIDEE